MKNLVSRKFVSLILSLAFLGTDLPLVGTSQAAADSGTGSAATVIYQNDFEGGVKPISSPSDVAIEQFGKSNALVFSKTFDGTEDWTRNQCEFDFAASESSAIPAGAILTFDLIIPGSSVNFGNIIKYTAAAKTGSNWDWNSSGIYGDLQAADFKDLGDGYCSAPVTVKFGSDLPAGLQAVVIQISSWKCNYSGKLGIDNLVFSSDSGSGQPTPPQVTRKVWDFSSGLGSWSYDGRWPVLNPDPTKLAYDSTVGGGSARLTAAMNVSQNWDEIKLGNNVDTFNLNGYNILTYDLYYNPKAMMTGSFKTKLYMKSDAGKDIVNQTPDIDLSSAQDVTVNGTAYKKVTVSVPFSTADANIVYTGVSIVGYDNDYNGDFYVDNITLDQKTVPDGYVTKTEQTTPQTPIDLSVLTIPTEVALADPKATTSTADLYAYLQGIAKSDKVLYGHQNDTHHKAGWNGGGASNSDTYDMVGDYPAVIGIDALSLTGDELALTDTEKTAGTTLIDKAANISIDASSKGAVVTMSCHMPNFADIAKKGKTNGAYDYSGYSPNVTGGNVVSRILPGGDLNAVYTGYLDMVAEYGQKLQQNGVSVLFRPFHEGNGSWFWWGAAFCSPSQYKNLYRYTEEYLRDTKGIHNFLYVYSPGGPFTDKNNYLARYPGDAFVDVMAFDMYHNNPTKDDKWMDSFNSTMDLVQSAAQDHHKLASVAETGILENGSALAKTGNARLDWFNEVLYAVSKHDMAYFMTWANFGEDNFDEPYMVSATRGHEMINNFVDFYNDDRSVFAHDMASYRSLNVQVQPAVNVYGYITSPNSYDRICSPTKVTAKVSGSVQKVQLAYAAAGKAIATVDAVQGSDGTYSADLTQDALNQLGKTTGQINLLLDGQTADSLTVLFNLPQLPADPSKVDDFEEYYGDNSLLQAAYSTNVGAGCSIQPQLTTDAAQRRTGNYGLAFNYSVSTEQVSEGWAGIIKALNGADWSSYNAIQFWMKPDGKGQKLVIQVKTDGEEFEANLSNLAAETTPQLVTIPFSQFKGKQNGVFNPKNVQDFAIYCNTLPPAGNTGIWSVNSIMYFDDIGAVNTNSHPGSGGKSTPPSTYQVSSQNGLTKVSVSPMLDSAPSIVNGSASLTATVAPGVDEIISGASRQNHVAVEIDLPQDAILQQLNASGVNSVNFTLNVPHSLAANWGTNVDAILKLESGVLQAAAQAKRDIIISIVDGSTQKGTYSWTFRGADLAKAGGTFKNLDIALNARPASSADPISRAIPASENLALFFADNGTLPCSAIVSVNATAQGFQTGQNLYLYYFNPATGLLEMQSGAPYAVGSDGSVSFPISHCSSYVLLPEKTTAATLDTGRALNILCGGTYQFKITASSRPSFVCGNSSVFQVKYASSKGNNYFFRVMAVGKSGDSAGFYVNGEKTPRTVGTVRNDAKSDTGRYLTVKVGGTYQFKITASSRPSFVCGNSSVFQVKYAGSKGNDYFFKIVSTGKPGDCAGIYVIRETFPRTVAAIVG